MWKLLVAVVYSTVRDRRSLSNVEHCKKRQLQTVLVT